MKVICIDNKTSEPMYHKIYLYLTIGKTYEAIEDGDYYKIIDSDDGHITRTYYKSRFITLNEYRDQKLSLIFEYGNSGK